MHVQRARTKQLRAPLTTTLGHPKSTQCNFNSCPFNNQLDYRMRQYSTVRQNNISINIPFFSFFNRIISWEKMKQHVFDISEHIWWESDWWAYSQKQNNFKGILYNFFIVTLEQIIVLDRYCTYNKPIPKISHAKTTELV